MHRLLLPLALVFTSLLSGTVLAKPRSPVIAGPLHVWVPWLLADRPELLCAGLGDGRECTWPGELRVKIDGQAGTFTLDVWLDAADDVALPGDNAAWPLQVMVDGKPGLVQAIEEHPAVALTPGHHEVTGRLEFGQVPELLAVPDAIGVVQLELGGQPVDLPKRDAEGRLFLRQSQSNQAAEQDTLSVTVARQLVDGVPMRVVTRLSMRVAGRPRDLVLGNVLLGGSRAIAAQSDLPLQVAGDGAMRVHVRPGEHQVDVDAVLLSDAASLTVPATAIAGAEAQETWVWVPDETQRSVELSGLAPIDPERTQLDADWKRAGRCYVATPGQVLQLKTTRRGEKEPPPSRIQLHRSLWLDLDGSHLTARDTFDGEMRTGWRLDLAPGGELGHVTLPGSTGALLITEHPTTKHQGVELRDGNLKLTADARVPLPTGSWPTVRELAAVGWLTDIQQLEATLHLPPGWKLVGVSGVDRPPRTWLDSWTLLDFFFVLMVAAAAWKLLGRPWGVLALVALVLCHDEPDAPQGLWLNVLLALALTRVVTAGKLATLVRLWHGAAVVVLLVVLVSFARDQVREGLYPQVAHWGKAPLAAGGLERAETSVALKLAEEAAPAAPPTEPEAAMEKKEEAAAGEAAQQAASIGLRGKAVANLLGASTKSGGDVDSYSQMNQQLRQLDPGAVVQTGPGVPRWQWQELQLGWSGPVRQDHAVQLLLLSPPVALALALLRVLLVVLLGVRLLPLADVRALAGRAGVLALLLACGSLVQPRPAFADFPAQPMLDEVAKRLEAAQACDGPCLVVSDLQLAIDGQHLTLTADVSAQRDTGWGLPGPWDPVQVSDVRIDGVPTRALRRMAGGLIAVRVPAGAHTVTAEATLPRRPVLTVVLDPGALPRHLAVRSQDWTAEGLQPGVVKDSLQLTRLAGLANDPSAVDAEAAPELPPWYHVERHLLLGLPWQVQTTVTRDRTGRAEVLKVPLLAQEHVTREGVAVETGADGQRVAVLHLGRDDASAVFESELPVAAQVQLTAPSLLTQPWTETWRVDCGAMWRCSFSGPAPVHTRDPDSAAYQPVWQPWPGERVQLDIIKPLGAKGAAITIDAAQYVVTPGQRLLEATLTLTIRTSQGGTQTLTLPEGALVQSVLWGDTPRAIRPVGRKLALPLDPGEQTVVVKWQQPWQRHGHEVVPPVDLGGPAVNVQVTLQLGEERWLLWTHGPDWGPAVLFWSHLLLVLLAALLLGRLRGLPVRARHWLLLGLGLLQVPAPALVFIVAWFIALSVRSRQTNPKQVLWANLGQVALVGLTAVFFGVLYSAIEQNLLGEVDMQVLGGGSSATSLAWYQDRVTGALPQPGVWSVPLLVWRVGMLLWALWLVAALLRWLPWAWRAFSAGGVWFRKPPKVPPADRKPEQPAAAPQYP